MPTAADHINQVCLFVYNLASEKTAARTFPFLDAANSQDNPLFAEHFQGHIRQDGMGGYYTPEGHVRSDGMGGYYTPNGHIIPDGMGGYYT
jgi:hypothetical protein